MTFPEELKYSRDDEWVKMLDDTTALIGITDYAQHEMSDIVFVNLPYVGDTCEKDVALCDIESVKAVADVICPVTGEVAEVNEELADQPQLLNEDPYGAWIAKVENITDFAELLTAEEYAALIASKNA